MRICLGTLSRQLFEENKNSSSKARKDKTLQRISVLSSNAKSSSASNKKGIVDISRAIVPSLSESMMLAKQSTMVCL